MGQTRKEPIVSPALIGAVVSITVAAIVYTIAVFAERRSGVLRLWHLVLFWSGFVFDTTGTTLMAHVAGGFRLNLHGVLGVAAIALMLIHSAWATVAIVQAQESVLRRFHRFSVYVWALWMLSLATGFGLAIPEMLSEARR
jgi:uncharacterized repeat protein (TIGR03987 family)